MSTNKVKTPQNAAPTPPAQPKKHALAKPAVPKKPLAPHKLLLLVTVIPRNKADFYLDLLQGFEVNMQLEASSFGTAGRALELGDREKQTLFSIIREDKAPDALAALEEKFSTIRGGKGIAFTVPFSSMVGVAAYRFLSNKQ